MNYKYIAIEGNIGAGKTTLAKALAKHLNTDLILENFEENPFLKKFYDNRQKHAFDTEFFFLEERYQQLTSFFDNRVNTKPVIADYFFGKSAVFAEINLSNHYAKMLSQHLNIFQQKIPFPDVIIHLNVDPEIQKQNITKRGRPYEQKIKSDYLDLIGAAYKKLLSSIEIPIISIHIDYERNNLHQLTESISEELKENSLPKFKELVML